MKRAGEGEKESACGEGGEGGEGGDGKGKEKKQEIRRHLECIIWQRLPPFPSSHCPRALSVVFLEIPSGSLCEGERTRYESDLN